MKLFRFGKSKSSRMLLLVIIVLAVFAIGYRAGRNTDRPLHPESHDHAAMDRETAEVWTCSMHPQIRRTGPGSCPICGMDLIPLTAGDEEERLGPGEIRLSPNARKLAGISVIPVARRHVSAEIRMVGKVAYDETRLAFITSRVPGRLDRLYVDYTGIRVKEGDHLIYLYSPELFAAQEELIQSLKAVEELTHLPGAEPAAARTLKAARKKLELLGLARSQIEKIETRGTPSEHLTIHAPIGGVVVHKHAVEGMYVQTGTRIYTIADLSQVWVKLDAYESDLTWVRYGQDVELRAEAYPGEAFRGKVAFIDPVLDPKTRTVKVRVNVPNPDGRLKPEMFVHAVIHAGVAAGGGAIGPALEGKWISPMHPEVVKDGPGTCDICGMPLVSAESLGYVAGVKVEPPLVIPASAPLVTGERAVVYLESPGVDGVYEGREILLGPRAGDHYVVLEGLAEGEMVVVNGNFKIDSALQILAKPSMMNPEGGRPAPSHHHHGGESPPTIPDRQENVPALPGNEHRGHKSHPSSHENTAGPGKDDRAHQDASGVHEVPRKLKKGLDEIFPAPDSDRHPGGKTHE